MQLMYNTHGSAADTLLRLHAVQKEDSAFMYSSQQSRVVSL